MELPATLAELLSVLREAGVTRFAQGDLHVELDAVRRVLVAPRPMATKPAPIDAVTAALNPPGYDPDQVDEGQ